MFNDPAVCFFKIVMCTVDKKDFDAYMFQLKYPKFDIFISKRDDKRMEQQFNYASLFTYADDVDHSQLTFADLLMSIYFNLSMSQT